MTILLFKIKVVLCVITRHHHRHRFEKKIIRSEREVNAEIESFLRRRRKTTFVVGKNKHTSLLLVVVKTRVKEDKNVRQKERTHFSYLQHGLEPVRHSSRHHVCVSSVLQRRSKSSVMLSREVKEVCSRLSGLSLPFLKKLKTLNTFFFLPFLLWDSCVFCVVWILCAQQ